MSQSENKVYIARYRLTLAVISIAFLTLVWRAFDLQIMEKDFLQSEGNDRFLRHIELPATRGALLDRNGDPLAVSTPVASVYVDPRFVVKNHVGWDGLAQVLGVDKREIFEKISNRKSKAFVYLKRHVPPEVERKVLALSVPGVATQNEYQRFYPAGDVSAHLIGITNVDDKGLEGLELAFEDELGAKRGTQKVIKDRLGNIVDEIGLLAAPEHGKEVRLTLDKRLQFLAYSELERAVVENKATSGSFVLLDSDSGEVLALVNLPSFNPNNRSRLSSEAMRNRAVVDVFEPGSTMKPFAVAAALREEMISPSSVIDTSPGMLVVGRNTIRDSHNYGKLTVSQVLMKSSNVGVSKIALALPKERLWEMFSDAGLGERTHSNFPGEMTGVLPFFGEWNEVEQASLSYGYGVSVTAMQLARAYSVIANGGTLKPITFRLGEQRPDLERRVLEKEVASYLRDMLRTVVSEKGTASRAAVSGYAVAGKTGTVKKLDKEGYTEDQYVATFVGMAPATKPKFVAVVVINQPRGEQYYGGLVAAPVFSKVMASALRLYNVPPDDIPGRPIRMASMEFNE
ncbi:MAG: penicillin-binding protein 2 [Gammaproteobacteria bacterium]|nr:penicillin-binding protein 2 [Gammaproteobacteria bacterium]MDH5691533.1 penicillin-binding protein 2 [Gammaproteobacteria bacterium]